MDEIDIKVLGGLLKSSSRHGPRGMFRGTYGRIAADLGLDEDTVRKRIGALKRSGILAGWDLYVHPSTFGCSIHSIWIDVDPRLDKNDVLKKVRLVHGVLGITDTFSQAIGVFLMHQSEKSFLKSKALILEISGGKELFDYRTSPPHGDAHLSPTDWNAIRVLRKDPTIPYMELGKAIGVSSRAAKRRMERLILEGVVSITPRIGFKEMKGVIPVDMIVSYSDPKLKEALDMKIGARIRDNAFRLGFGDESHGHFTFATRGIAGAKEIREWVSNLEGVRSARLELICDQTVFPDAYDELLPWAP